MAAHGGSPVDGTHFTPQDILRLQGTVGNQAVLRMLDRTPAPAPRERLMREAEVRETPQGREFHVTCSATADFENTARQDPAQVAPLRPSDDCEGECAEDDPCVQVSARWSNHYDVEPQIDIPSLDGLDLNDCERQQAQDFIDTVLRPHEEEHRQRFETYDGTTNHQTQFSACQSEAAAILEERTRTNLEDEAEERKNAAIERSDEIDNPPFDRTIHFNCPAEDSEQEEAPAE